MSGDLNFNLSPLGPDRIRLTGFADFVGLDATDGERNRMSDVLINHARYLFPTLKWSEQRPIWLGYRPMSPDGLPYIGKDKYWTNLYLSCGHGSNGWTTSVGSADVLSRRVFIILNCIVGISCSLPVLMSRLVTVFLYFIFNCRWVVDICHQAW